MNPLQYLKAVIGAVGANVFPPICEYLVGFITAAPANVRTALSILMVALGWSPTSVNLLWCCGALSTGESTAKLISSARRK